MAETAMVISFTLVLLFGILQLAIIGYMQIAGDQAVFVAAHQYSLGVSPTAIASAEGILAPKAIASAITYTPAPPSAVGPTADALMNSIYGPMASHGRTGGFTLVRPQNFTAYLSTTARYNGILQFTNMPINSSAVEGFYLMTNQEMDNFGLSPDDPNALLGNILNPANASPFLPQSDATVANMNTPPYYLPNPIMKICSAPWQGGPATFGTICTGGNPQVWFLGLAETLENTNYASSSGKDGVGVGDVFASMSAHQRIYANLIPAFPALNPVQQLANAQLACIHAQFASYNNTLTAAISAACPLPSPPYGSGFTSLAAFPNMSTGSSCPASLVPLYWYDPLRWKEQYGGVNWNPRQMWATEPLPAPDPGGDGPEGPCSWNGASFALVYDWDQPNFPGTFIGPGTYPANPTAGSTAAGDPGY
jgi:hypothetical protein